MKKVDTPTEDIQVKQTKTAKRKSLKTTVKQAAGPFGSLVSGKLILFPCLPVKGRDFFGHGRRAKHIKISCLPRSLSLNCSSPR